MSAASLDAFKRKAAEQAVALIQSGMVVGLGTGSTAALAVEAIGQRMRDEGLAITGIPTSERTAEQARGLGIPLSDFGQHDRLDLTIDGADAVQPGTLALIKGLGGALLREKIVAAASARMIVIVDDSKLRGPLGSFCPVPVEVTRFGWQATRRRLAELAGTAVLRCVAGGSSLITDGGNHIIDCDFGAIADAAATQSQIRLIPGVVESGLFVGIATEVIIAGADGVKILYQST